MAARLIWVDRSGAEQPVNAPARAYLHPRISPDGQRVALGIADTGTQIWVYDFARETLTQVTFQGNDNLVPLWSPDGKRIAFISSQDGQRNIFCQAADGKGGAERLTTGPHLQVPGSWSPGGELLAYSQFNPGMGYDIWVLQTAEHRAEAFLQSPFDEQAPQFSPDGRRLAYASNEAGGFEIYVRPYPGPGLKRRISTEGGREPLWNRNGRELFYRDGDRLMAVEIAVEPEFAASAPKMLFRGPYQTLSTSSPNYDVAPDGQRFLMLKPAENSHIPNR